jgi:cell division protein FtsB
LSAERDVVASLRGQIATLEVRLASGIEENEALYRRIKELEKPTMAIRDRARSVDSLSDLTNIDLDLDFAQIDKER